MYKKKHRQTHYETDVKEKIGNKRVENQNFSKIECLFGYDLTQTKETVDKNQKTTIVTASHANALLQNHYKKKTKQEKNNEITLPDLQISLNSEREQQHSSFLFALFPLSHQ